MAKMLENRSMMIHIGVEALALLGVLFITSKRNNELKQKIIQLEERLQHQEDTNASMKQLLSQTKDQNYRVDITREVNAALKAMRAEYTQKILELESKLDSLTNKETQEDDHIFSPIPEESSHLEDEKDTPLLSRDVSSRDVPPKNISLREVSQRDSSSKDVSQKDVSSRDSSSRIQISLPPREKSPMKTPPSNMQGYSNRIQLISVVREQHPQRKPVVEVLDNSSVDETEIAAELEELKMDGETE